MKNQSRKNKAMKEFKALLNKLSAIDATRDPLVKRVCQLGKMLGVEIPRGEVA